MGSFFKMAAHLFAQVFLALVSLVSASTTTSTSYFSTSVPTFPSCLQPNVSWAVEEVTSVTLGVETPELCQQICQANPACVAITWTQDSFPVYPLRFSSTDNATQCEDCVSGPPVCSCSLPGECE